MKNKLNIIILSFIFIFSVLGFFLNHIYKHTISLKGDKYITILLNEDYVEYGAVNKYDSGSVEINGSVDNTKIGEYKIEYSSKYLGFNFKKYRYVTVVDKEKPIINLIGDDEVTICPKATYKEDGYNALDNYDGDISSKVEVIKEDNLITYKVLDSSNNSYSTTRKINRSDKEAPSISLKGNSTYYIFVGNSFTDPGYSVKDNCDSNIKVKVDGSVDTNVVGTYKITYTATDSSNNTNSVTRYVRVRDLSSNTGVIYLTFDDGPSSSSTPKILDILDRKGVKATFFVVNHDSSLDYLIKRAYDSGHTIALHSYTHNYAKIYSSKENFYNDLDLISKKVESITGEKSMIMRFPGGGSNTVSRKYTKGIMSELTKEVIDKGYRYYDWNVSSGDAGGAKNSDAVYKNVINGLKENRDNIVLMHDFSNSKSVGALEAIIDYGLANGYRFDKIDMTTPMVRHGVNN